MKVGVPRETAEGERRVALVPEGASKLADRDLEVVVESGAGRDYNLDEAYEEAGATVAADAAEVWRSADVIVKVQPPTEDELELVREGIVIVTFLQPGSQGQLVGELAQRGATVFSMDAIPRIARAQSMDALSSMSSIGGYKSVVIAADALGKYLPMMTTAAGTIKAGKVLVLGAGVAGLQAIATARRLGAQVSAFDIRPEVKEQIESIGATFVEPEPEQQDADEPVEQEEEEQPKGLLARIKAALGADELVADGDDEENHDSGAEPEVEEEEEESTGGYAREQAEEKQAQDRELIRERMRETDVVITTALVPGKRAPILITEEMVDGMSPGSVIVDLAAEAGGNCELTRPGEVVEHGLVRIIGPLNLPSQMPVHASELYSRNIVSLLSHLVEDGELELDFDDEITAGACLTHEGEVRHGGTQAAPGARAAGDRADQGGQADAEGREPEAAEAGARGRDT